MLALVGCALPTHVRLLLPLTQALMDIARHVADGVLKEVVDDVISEVGIHAGS